MMAKRDFKLILHLKQLANPAWTEHRQCLGDIGWEVLGLKRVLVDHRELELQ
jgi:hypothetical protein